MARRKAVPVDSKQSRLSSTLKLRSPNTSPTNVKKVTKKVNKETSPRKLKRNATKSPAKTSPLQKSKKNSPKGRPKPQATASARIRHLLPALTEIKVEPEQANNNNNEEKSPVLNNNNNNNNNNEKEKQTETLSLGNEDESTLGEKENESIPLKSRKENDSTRDRKEKDAESRKVKEVVSLKTSKEKESTLSEKENEPTAGRKEKDSLSCERRKEKVSPGKSKKEKKVSDKKSNKVKEFTSVKKQNETIPSPLQAKENKSPADCQIVGQVTAANFSPEKLMTPASSMSKINAASRAISPPSLSDSATPTSKSVKCKVCKQWFPNRYFQRKHMLMEHEDQLYECRVCSFNSVDPEKLKSHIIKLHVAKKEKNDSFALDLQGELEKLIDRKVPRKVMMEDGVTLGRDVNSKMRYVCALCSRIYTSKYSLERHVRCHTLEKPYHCDVCPFTSSYREHMMRHMTSVHLIVHSNVPKVKYIPKKRRPGYEDDGSDSLSPESSDGNSKKRRNILRERFECAVCGLKATHKTDLVDHIKNKHPNAHIESLENNDGSKVHLIVTMAKKPKPTKKLTIQCSYCFLIFHDTWKFKVHMRSHTGVKPFQCSLCDVRATSKMTVRDHIHRKHKDQVKDAKILLRTVGIDGSVEEVEMPVPWKEFKCDVCSKQFEDNYNLKTHKQKEHKAKFPFFCIICSHKELTKAGMIIHCSSQHKKENLDDIIMKNDKPCKIGPLTLPKCEICDRLFPYRSQLNIHLKSHTGERAFSCDHCDYKTNLKQCLDKHVQKIHFGRKNVGDNTRKKLAAASTAKRGAGKPRGRPRGKSKSSKIRP